MAFSNIAYFSLSEKDCPKFTSKKAIRTSENGLSGKLTPSYNIVLQPIPLRLNSRAILSKSSCELSTIIILLDSVNILFYFRENKDNTCPVINLRNINITVVWK